MIKYLRLPFSFDVKRLQESLAGIDRQQWKMHYQQLHYSGEWSGIPLRSMGGNADNLLISPTENPDYKDTIYLQQSLYLQEVLAVFKCPLQAVRLLKLNAGAVIKEHTDAALFFEKGAARFHIPIITDDAVEFYSDKERLFMREGECWYVNFNLPHAITNNSNINRVHLVIDATVNDWMTSLFNSVAAVDKKEIDERSLIDDNVKREMIKSFRAMNTPKGNELADQWEAYLNKF